MAFYVLDENNNKVEAYDKQGVLAVLAQAIADGSLENIVADSAFINKLKCCVGGDTFKVAFITQANYNELVANDLIQKNTYYYITDDTTAEDIDKQLENLTNAVNDLKNNVKDFTEYKNIDQVQIITLNAATDLLYDSEATTQPKIDLTAHLTERNINNIIGLGGVLYVTTPTGNFELFFTAFNNEYDNSHIKEHQVIKADADNNIIRIFIFSLGITSEIAGNRLYLSKIICKEVDTRISTETILTVGVDTLRIYYKK